MYMKYYLYIILFTSLHYFSSSLSLIHSESACYYCPNSSCTSDPYIRYHSVGSYEYNTIK